MLLFRAIAHVSIAASAVALAGPAAARQAVTLEDAYSIRSVSSLDVRPDGKTVAIEADGAIQVMDLASRKILKRIEGQSPHWSPDGRRLAFYARRSGELQLHVWQVATDTEFQITHLPQGIFVNIHALSDLCDSQQISWSPDSREIAFMSIDRSQEFAAPATSDSKVAVVYDAERPLNRSLVNGLFGTPNFWVGQMGKDGREAEILTSIDEHPEQGAAQVFVANIDGRSTRVLAGAAAQYLCPVWSPNGEKIAAIADTTPSDLNPDAYGYGFGRPRTSTVALLDVRSGAEKIFKPAAPKVVVRGWLQGADRLLMIVESREIPFSFKRLAEFSVADGSLRFIETPEVHAVKEIRAAPNGHFLVKLAGRFADTLWSFNTADRTFNQVNTFDWSIEPQARAFDGISADAVVFWADAKSFKGRLILSRARKAQVLYDANPQVAAFKLGDQKRVTWKNSVCEEVDGLVIFPPGYARGHRYPVIVNAYPVPALDDFRLSASIENTGQLQATEGYIVFRPAIRAPHGAYWFSRDEMYQEKARGAKGIPIMVDDFESGLRYLIEQGWADPQRIGIYGHSNGGWVANILITESKMITAAVVESGVSNMVMAALWPYTLTTRSKDPATGGNVFDNLDDYIKLSPLFKMRDVKIPMLLMVGEDDWLWVPQMVSQYGVLRSENRNVTLVRYPHESHSLEGRAAVIDARQRISAFFNEYLRFREKD